MKYRIQVERSRKNEDLSKDSISFPKRQPSAHHTQEINSSTFLCSFCGEPIHITTNGPGNSKLVQYFVCKRFVNMPPPEWFFELKSKGFCFQCLYPGASSSQTKHKEGRCQRDFVCQHESHDKYSMRKHVLCCDEHKDQAENQVLLQKYK